MRTFFLMSFVIGLFVSCINNKQVVKLKFNATNSCLQSNQIIEVIYNESYFLTLRTNLNSEKKAWILSDKAQNKAWFKSSDLKNVKELKVTEKEGRNETDYKVLSEIEVKCLKSSSCKTFVISNSKKKYTMTLLFDGKEYDIMSSYRNLDNKTDTDGPSLWKDLTYKNSQIVSLKGVCNKTSLISVEMIKQTSKTFSPFLKEIEKVINPLDELPDSVRNDFLNRRKKDNEK